MIQIKRWTDGKVLYTAENAADVKSALEEAVREDANLGYADLGSANLGYANLGYADLGSANLGYEHPLWAFWVDFASVLDQAPAEVAGLRAAIAEGNIDGSVYEGSCACLVGTIANVRHVSVEALDIPKDASRPAEHWFMPIRKSDVPLDDPTKATETEGVFRASVALKWIDEWAASRLAVAKALAA